MELKDTAVALTGFAVVMVAPGYFTEAPASQGASSARTSKTGP
jgi:hypothetical protein